MMRFFLMLALLFAFNLAQSEEVKNPTPPVPNKAEANTKKNNPADAKHKITVNLPSSVKSQSEQTRAYEEPNKWTDPITLFTFLLVIVTGGLIFVGWSQGTANKIIERAYVKLSHTTPPGLVVEDASGICMVTLQVENSGSTPAQVTDVCVTYRILPHNESLPDEPDYDLDREREIPNAFLVKDSRFLQTYSFAIRPFENVASIKDGTKRLWLYGFVDYIDMFGQPHRGGYARIYIPGEQGNNLVFIGKEQYNYDRKRKRGEGKKKWR